MTMIDESSISSVAKKRSILLPHVTGADINQTALSHTLASRRRMVPVTRAWTARFNEKCYRRVRLSYIAVLGIQANPVTFNVLVHMII